MFFWVDFHGFDLCSSVSPRKKGNACVCVHGLDSFRDCDGGGCFSCAACGGRSDAEDGGVCFTCGFRQEGLLQFGHDGVNFCDGQEGGGEGVGRVEEEGRSAHAIA